MGDFFFTHRKIYHDIMLSFKDQIILFPPLDTETPAVLNFLLFLSPFGHNEDFPPPFFCGDSDIAKGNFPQTYLEKRKSQYLA